jgi:putative flippase GtrA
VTVPWDRWQTRVERWLKFNAVGGIGMGVQLVVLAGLKSGLDLNYLLATAVAVEAAVLHNFFWHERFTWRECSTGKSWGRLVKFNLTTGTFSILGNSVLMKWLIEGVHFEYLPADGITIAACSIASFLLSDRFVFQDGWGPGREG